MATQQYDPSNPQPYQAYQPPETKATADPLPPPPNLQGPGFQPSFGPSRLGGIATVLDNVLHGFVQGRQMKQAQQVMQARAKQDNLRASYEQDAQRLWQLAQAGTPKTDPDFIKAQQAVQGSWGALQDWIGQHIQQDDQKGKKKSKKGQDDPQQQARDRAAQIFQLSQKLGPPVLGQVQQFYTPEAQANRQAQNLNAQHEQNRAQAQTAIDELLKTPQEQWTEAQKQSYESNVAIVNEGRQEKPVAHGQTEWLVDPKTGEKREFEIVDGKRVAVQGAEGFQPVPPTPKESTTTRQYKGPGGQLDWFKPGDEPDGWTAVPVGGRGRAAGGSGGTGSNPITKRFNNWVNFFKSQGQNDADARQNAKAKVEGAGMGPALSLAQKAEDTPGLFDSDIIGQAMQNIAADPANKEWVDPQTKQLKPEIQEAFANFIGHNDNPSEDDAEWQYRQRSDLDQIQPDSKGKYSGGVDKATLAKMEQKLQGQINNILSPANKKMAALTPDELKAARRRMAPIFGPGAKDASNSSQSPGTGDAASGPAASSQSAPGGSKKGVVKKSQFLKANPGATDADWQAIKPQLEKEYDVKDD